MRTRLWLVLAALVATGTAANAGTLTLHPLRDNTLFFDAGGLIATAPGPAFSRVTTASP
jgi:hypothetical protein